MPAESHTNLELELAALVRRSPWFMPALEAVRRLGLASWCIGAGAIRNLVWDSLHGYSTSSALADIDVAFFDPHDLSQERDRKLQAKLSFLAPDLPWEVTNQASVHRWFEAYFGHSVQPLLSLEEAVASWPEFATAVGVYLTDSNKIEVIAPHGLEDLFRVIIRRNPARVSLETYRQRIAEKRYAERWPKVKVVP